MQNIGFLILMLISLILILILSFMLKRKHESNQNQLQKLFLICLWLLFIWIFCFILQILFQNSSVNPIFFEGLASFGACFLPVTFMLLSISFTNTKIKFNFKYILLYIIPIISTILMLTNPLHHLFFKVYSTYMKNATLGSYFLIHAIYSYACLFIGILILLKYSIKNSGFFSRQSLLLIIGSSIPLLINCLGTFRNYQYICIYNTYCFCYSSIILFLCYI